MFLKKECVYLDNSATSRFKPRSVVKAVERELKASANAGRGGHKAAVRAGMLIEDCRARTEKLTFPGNVVMTKSCTEALNIGIFGLEPRGEIVTSVYEHNSVLRPIERLKQRGVSVKYLSNPTGIIEPEEVARAVNSRTSLVVLSEMSNVTGQTQDVAALGSVISGFGCPFLVDGAQSLGHTESDYSGVDMIAGAGHKGLHAPQGTGFLCFRKGIKLNPLLCGGTGTDSASLVQPTEPPEGFESGTLNAAGIAGLNEGIKWTMKFKERINLKIRSLAEELVEELKKIEGVILYTRNYNGVVSFNLGDFSSTEVADVLDARYGIAVRAGLHCAPLLHKWLGTIRRGTVRASIGANNSHSDVEKLLIAVKEILS